MELNLKEISQSLLANLNNIQNMLEAQIDETKDDIVERIDNYYEVHDVYNTLHHFVTESNYKDHIPNIISKAQKLIESYESTQIL